MHVFITLGNHTQKKTNISANFLSSQADQFKIDDAAPFTLQYRISERKIKLWRNFLSNTTENSTILTTSQLMLSGLFANNLNYARTDFSPLNITKNTWMENRGNSHKL